MGMTSLYKITVAIALLIGCGTAAAQTNTGDYPNAPSLMGGDIGSGEGGQDDDFHYNGNHRDLMGYCPRALGILLEKMKFSYNPNHGWARKRALVVQGFQRALEAYTRWPSDIHPLTRTALRRGLVFNESFNGICRDGNRTQNESCQRAVDMNAYRLMLVFANHVVNEIGPLDQYYYIPYRTGGRCSFANCDRDIWWDSFWSHYKDSAVSILELYMGRSTESGLPESFGYGRIELRAAANILNWAGEDIANDEFRRRYACTYVDLKLSARTLKRFLEGDTDDFGYGPEGERAAVEYARMTAEEALSALRQTNCSGRSRAIPRYDLPRMTTGVFPRYRN